jgi:hypothetical protein
MLLENDGDDEALRGNIGSSDEASHGDLKATVDPEMSELLQYIEGIVGCLTKLVPNLCDPFPVDTYSNDATPDDANPDINLASTLFPTATKEMLERLGWANWRRRKHLKNLQEKRRPGMPLGELSNRHMNRIKKNTFRDVAVDAFNFQKPGLKPQKVESEKVSTRPVLRTIPSFLAPSTVGAPSIFGSIFSNPESKGDGSVTSATEFEPEPELEPIIVKHQTVPKPPIPLEEKRAFLCPYCNDEIDVGVNIATTTDWEGHVFSDLEPYMCTFDDCIRAEKTYGVRDDWFRHELESHRIMKVWVCQSCVLEFSFVQDFEAHLQKKHNNICGPSQMAMMVSLCMKHSERHLKKQICPLCALKIDIEPLKDHIAEHLEQLALTSVNGDESSEEDDSDEIGSQFSYGNASEGKTKMEILNDFVEEQLNYVLPEKKGPADRAADKTNLDFVGDSDEDSEDEGGLRAPSIRRPGDETRDWKLAHYLGNQAGPQDKPNNESNRRGKSPRGRVDLSFHNVPKSASSTSALGPLRTVLHPRDVDFVGRDGDLANLYKILSVSGRICTINGTGGIGKTATAIEYTFRYEQAYSYIFWTQAETRVGYEDTFSLIATALGLASEGEDQSKLIELGRDFLETTEKKWLLVFDNVDEWADIEEYIPMKIANTHGSVMVTSRDSDIGPTPIPTNYFRINLKEMTPDESRSLLMQGIQSEYKLERAKFHPEWKVAGQIASLAGLPLAISHIAGYVKASGCTLAEFLELWNEWRKNSLSARPPEASSNVALETIWSMGLSDLGFDALKLLKIMAFFDSDVIQKELLMNDHSASSLAFLHSSRLLG